MQIFWVLTAAWNSQQACAKDIIVARHAFISVCTEYKTFKSFYLVSLVIQIKWGIFRELMFQRNSVLRNKVLENAGNPLRRHDKFGETPVEIIGSLFPAVNCFKWMSSLKS